MLASLVEPVYAPLLTRANDDLRELLWRALDNRRPIALRDYQVTVRDAVLTELDQGHATLAALATGCGKTEVGLGILQAELERGNLSRALIFAHLAELIFQPVERMVRGWPGLPCPGIVMGDMNMPDARIVVATAQTLSARKGRRLEEVLSYGAFSHLIIDETHRATARTYREIIKRLREANPALRILGLTATPERSDGDGLRGILTSQPKAAQINVRQAVQIGALVPFVAADAELKFTLGEIDEMVRAGWDEDEALGDVMSASNALEIVVATWKKTAWLDREKMIRATLALQAGEDVPVPDADFMTTHRPSMAFATSVKQSKRLAQAFEADGIYAASVDGTTPKKERWEAIRAYKAGEIKVLANMKVFTEGFDAPQTSCILWARPTKSPLVYAQGVGRGLRIASDKTECLIVDFCPVDGREKGLMFAGDLLGKPKSQQKAEKKLEQLGVILDVFGISSEEFGMDADPDAVILKIRDFFAGSSMKKLAWTVDGTVASVSTGQKQALVMVLPQRARLEKAERLRGGPEWNPLWENEYQRIRRYHLYVLEDNKHLEHIASSDSESAVYEAAERWAEDSAEGWASGRGRQWRKRPATFKREEYARKLGVWRDGMSDGQASQAITHELALRALRRKNFIR